MYFCQNKSCKAYMISVPSALVLEGNFKCYICSTSFLSEETKADSLAQKIYSEYPSLIARPYSAMLSRQDSDASLKRLLDVFTGLLKLLATLFESEYLHSKKLDPVLTEIIAKDLKTPTLGKWMYYLHSALIEKKLEEVVFVEYRDYFLTYYNDLSSLLKYRNEFYHTFQGSSIKLAEDYSKNKILLDKLLFAFPQTSGLYIRGKDKRVISMNGLNPIIIENCPLKFEDSEALFWDGKNRSLSLFPLHAIDEEEVSNSFMYVASTDKRIIYEGLHGETLDTVRTQKRYKELINRKTSKRTVLKDDKDKELVLRMQEETRRTLKELLEVGKYIPEKYVRRVYPEREIDRFLKSSMVGLIVLSNSGGGKSGLLSYISEKLLSENIPILFLQGKQLNDESIEAQLQGLLDMDFDLSEALRNYNFQPDKTFRGILIIDAINEAQNPERVLQGVLKYTSELRDSEIKIIISMRLDFWNGIDIKNKEEAYPLNLFFTPLSENSEPEKESRLMLNPLTGEERNAIYKKFGGIKETLEEIENLNRPLWEYFQIPLHIYFFCNVEQNFLENHFPSPDSIRKEYFQNYVIQKKQNLADCLRALGFFLLNRDVSQISLETAWEDEATKRFLKDRKPDSPFSLLTKSDILREYRSGGETYIILTYDAYLEEAVGLALLSKPYKGSGKMLVGLSPNSGILQSSIASLLARSALNKEFKEILGYLDESYRLKIDRGAIQELYIQKISEYSSEILILLSERILSRSIDLDWNILYCIAKKLRETLKLVESMELYPMVLERVKSILSENEMTELYTSYGEILELRGFY